MKQFSIRAEESVQRCYLYKCHKQTTSRIKHRYMSYIIHAYQTSNARTYELCDHFTASGEIQIAITYVIVIYCSFFFHNSAYYIFIIYCFFLKYYCLA